MYKHTHTSIPLFVNLIIFYDSTIFSKLYPQISEYLRESTGNVLFQGSSHSRGQMCPLLNGLSDTPLLQPTSPQCDASVQDHFVFQGLHHCTDLKD